MTALLRNAYFFNFNTSATVYKQAAGGFPSTNSQGQLQTPQSVSVHHRNEPPARIVIRAGI